ncbi:MAG: hypothetical protein WKF61_06205 [Luteimonas sp.]
MNLTDQTLPGILATAEKQLAVADIVRITRGQWAALMTELAKAQAQVEEP